MPYLSVDDIRLYYEEGGDGDPLLFLHGLGSSTRDWFAQVPHFADDYRVIRLDLRGHGRSERPRGPYHMAQFSRDVAVCLRHLDVGPAHVVGLSMGGMVAFQLAADTPDLIRSLVIVNSVADARLHTWHDVWFYLSRRFVVRMLGMRRVGRIIAHRLFVKSDQEELRREFIKRWAANDRRAYLWSIDAIMGWSVEHRLSDITAPTLVVSSEDDYTPVSTHRRIATQLPNAVHRIVPDARHALPVEKPEVFNVLVETFLEGITSRAVASA